LGTAITGWLEDPTIVEVMLNPDGRLWIDRLAGGLADTGERLSAAGGERIVRLVAHHVGAEVHPASPRVSAELPGTGERFEGLIPPVVAAPAFANAQSPGVVGLEAIQSPEGKAQPIAFRHIGETDCMAGVIGLELRCAERKFISLTSRPNSDLRDTAQTVAVSREDNLLC